MRNMALMGHYVDIGIIDGAIFNLRSPQIGGALVSITNSDLHL
jgi:hypothetical protein